MAPADNGPSPTYSIRTHRPGDMGMIVSRHGSLYACEYGWNARFEASTARIAADFLENHDPDRERVFVAESVGTAAFLGCIALLKHRGKETDTDTDTAHLRLLLVDPAARGTGLGARLIEECVGFARRKGYARIVLWTVSSLEGARRLYGRAGFRHVLTADEKDDWGVRVSPELWELALS